MQHSAVARQRVQHQLQVWVCCRVFVGLPRALPFHLSADLVSAVWQLKARQVQAGDGLRRLACTYGRAPLELLPASCVWGGLRIDYLQHCQEAHREHLHVMRASCAFLCRPASKVRQRWGGGAAHTLATAGATFKPLLLAAFAATTAKPAMAVVISLPSNSI